MGIVLYNHDLLADAYKVKLLLSVLGMDFERRTVGILPGNGNDAPAYRDLNPAGTVPTLVDGDVVLTRPEAMLVHIAECHDTSGRWLPAEPLARAQVFEWLAFATGDLAAAEAARLQAMFGVVPALADAFADTRAAFRLAEGHLARRALGGLTFIAANHPTIADLAIFPAVALAADVGIGMEEFPRLLIWARQIHALPGFITMPGVREVI